MKDHNQHEIQMSEAFLNSAFLALSGGFQDAYTYNARNEVFCNAQTGNVVLMSQHFMAGELTAGLGYFFPIIFFALGVWVAEKIQANYKYAQKLHWRQGVLLAEILILFTVGFLPTEYNMLANAMASFACAMQVQSFRKVNGYSYASTMCIGNLRSGTAALSVYFREKKSKQLKQAMYYFGIILASVILIAVNTRHMFSGFAEAFQQSAFQVGSIITTTGYSSTDFNQWPALSKTILVLLMFVGACAGSTGGGIKVSRVVLLCKAARKEFQLYLHPNAVKKLKMDNKAVSHETLRSTNIFLSVYLLIFCGSILIVSLDNFDLVTNFTTVAATLNNIGPGLEVAGPMGNFSSFSYLSKSVMIFDMLAGRLEIFPLLLLFFKDTWKKF